jgi:hypothetical protein
MPTDRIPHKDIGDLWTPRASFAVNAVATDPSTLVVKVRDPDGLITTITENTPAALTPSSTPIKRISAGVFEHAGISLTEAGYWQAKFSGTGTVVAAETYEIVADPDEFTDSAGLGARALVGLRETKDWLNQQNIDTSEDWELVRVINDISDRFHKEAEREFKVDGTNPQTRTFIAEPVGRRMPQYIDGDYVGDYNSTRRRIKVGDMASAPTVVQLMDSDWTTVLETVAVSDVTALPSPRASSDPITELEFQTDVTSLSNGMRVKVTGAFGFPSVPGDVRQAVLDAVASTMDRDVEHYRSDLGAGGGQQGDTGTVVVVGGRTGGRLLSLPPAAQAVAWRYRATSITVG